MLAKFMADFLFSFLFSTLPQAQAPMGAAMPTARMLLCETISAMYEDNLTTFEFLSNTN